MEPKAAIYRMRKPQCIAKMIRNTWITAVLAALLLASSAHAQTGVVDVQELLFALPEYAEYKSAAAEIDRNYARDLAARQQALNEAVAGLQTAAPEETPQKVAAIFNQQRLLSEWQTSMSQESAKQKAELLNALYDKIYEACEDVASERNLTLVISGQVPEGQPEHVLYASDTVLITNLVAAKLGL